jgi:hypothetical protein
MILNPNILNTPKFVDSVIPHITIGQYSTNFLHVPVYLMGVDTIILCPNGYVFILHIFKYEVEINECVAHESNSVHTRLPNRKLIYIKRKKQR